MWGGVPVKLAVVSTASVLLLFASNTGIIGAYHVFLALANGGFLPQAVTWRNRQFGSPHLAICVATLVPIGVVIVTQAELGLLADMYVFGLLGAFVMSSAGLDLIRWRRRQHGIGFWVGILTTLMLAVAWGVNIFEKPHATLFGGALIATGMVISVSAQQGWFSDLWYQIPFIARAASQRISAAELETEEIPNLISLSEAHEIMTLYPSRTLEQFSFRWIEAIAGVADIVSTLGRREGREGRPHRRPQGGHRARRNGPQAGFEFGKDVFNRIEVGAVGGQVEQVRPSGLDRGAHASHFMAGQIVHHDPVARVEGGDEHLFDIGHKAGAIDWAVQDRRGGEAIRS